MDVVIKQEKDDSGHFTSGRWLTLPVDGRACEWCSAPDYMRDELPKFVNEPLDDWPPDLLLDLCYCNDCVQEYHRLQEELTDESKKLLHLVDIDRLTKTITNALDKVHVDERGELQEVATKLQVPLLEILRFPYLLHDARLADLFKRGLIALNVCGCPLTLEELEEKLPGTYLLLVHPDPEVRGWAVRSVRGQGLINQDDYDVLKDVIGWMIEVVEYNLFENADLLAPENKPFECMYLPSHLFIPLTIREYWLGLFVLLRQMDVETMQSCFMSFTGHLQFLNIIVSPMMEKQESMEDDGAFWPRLQCFVVLLERLGNRIWQISLYKPHQLFMIITENHFFHNAIMQWQNNEGEGAFSQDMFGNLQRTRQLSSSSDAKHCGRFYKTALAWFQPFVQYLLDFESRGDCLSLVIKYLHNLADDCLRNNTFKLDIQSTLLRIIHELLARRMFELLAPTVSIWAVDVLDAVISELGDKKMVEATRKLLQHLLKACHRLGHKHALKYWEKFRLPGAKQLSAEDKQLIISLLVQAFKAQHDPAFQKVCSSLGTKAPTVYSSDSTKAPTVHSSGSTKVPAVHSSGGDTKAPTVHSSGSTKAPTVHSSASSKAPTVHSGGSTKVPGVHSSGSTKALTVHSSGSTKVPTVHSSGSTKAPTVHSSHSSKAPAVHSRHGIKGERQKSKDETEYKPLHQSSIQMPGIRPLKEMKAQGSRVMSASKHFAMESSGKAHQENIRSLVKPGPSTQFTSSEDEQEEKSYWNNKKRRKKLKQSFGKVRVCKSSLRMRGSPIQARVHLKDCMASMSKVKAEKGIKREVQSTTRPKKRHRARKSAGITKKYTRIQQNSGATSEDPIVLSDEDESPKKLSEQKEPISTGNKDAGFLDDYFCCGTGSSGNDDVALIQFLDEYESPQNAAKSNSTVENTTADKSLMEADFSSENNSSDEELLHSYMESKDINLLSVKPSPDYNGSFKGKAEKTDLDTDVDNVMDYDDRSDDVALLDFNKVESSCKTKLFSGIQRTTVSKSSVKADLSSEEDSSDDDKPLSYFYAAHKASKSSYVRTPETDIAPQVTTEELVLEGKTASCNEVINATSPGISTHGTHFPEIKTEVEGNTSSFAEVSDIQGGVDYVMDESSNDKEEKFEDESGSIVSDAEPNLQAIQTEPTAQGEETTSLSIISEQLLNDATIDDGTSFWGNYCDYSELVVNSQENALARVEEDLDDLYSTQVENWEENDNILPSTDGNDKAVSNEVNQTAKAKKHVRFATDLSSADTVASTSRSSVSHAAITQPSRALSEDEFFHEILSWKTERLCNVQSNGRGSNLPRNYFAETVPDSFESIDQYYNTFKPLLFMEIWEQAFGSWWDKGVNRKCVAMNVLDGSTANSFWVIPCSGIINEHQQRKAFFPLEGDLVLLTLAAGDEGGSTNEHTGLSYSSRAVFGFVEKADVKRVVHPSQRFSMGSSGGDDESSEAKWELKLDIKTTSNFRPGRNCRIQVEFVTSLLTARRQWSGLMHLSKSILASDILRPRKTDYFCSNDYSQSAHVAKEYNESQEKVISTAANVVYKPFPIPRICLVQGPPGTGKSYTIVGLVKEILNRAQKMPAQTPKGPSNGTLANKVRILLCAPSNAAIDELIGRLKEAQIQLDKHQDNKANRRFNRQDAVKSASSSNCGDLCLVRVGRKTNIHPSVMKFSLDSMTKQVLEKVSASTTEDELNKIKEKLKSIHNKEKKLECEIWKLKTLPQPNQHDQHELQKLENEKAELIKSKNFMEKNCRIEKAKHANKRREEARIRRDILNCADVICTTLSGAGSGSLMQDLGGRRVCPFTCIIVDEACQSNELELLIPLWFQASKLVLVGDPEQLPSTVLSVRAKDKLFGRSMFGRLYRFFRHQKDMEKPVLMLEEQYRMHPEIAAFPSSHVYNNYLKSHRSLEKRPFPLTKHYALFDVVRGREISQDRRAVWNPAELELIAELCRDLTRILHVESIGVITPYRKQTTEIQNRLKEKDLSKGDAATIEVNTVDSFQGREKDVIILSCVRAQTDRGTIGFLRDRQRMNVALTRARHALYVFGHMETLKGGSTDWKALVEDAEKRHCLFVVESRAEVRSILSIGPSNNDQSQAKDPRLETKHTSAQGSDSHGNSSRRNDHAVHQMEINEGQVMSVSRDERQQSVTAGGMVHVPAAEMASETSPLARTISTTSEPLLSSGEGDDHAAASRKKVVNPTQIDKQEQGKHDLEGTRHRERYHKETREVQRHRPRSDDRRYDGRHHGNRDSGKRDQNRRPNYRREDGNGTSKESSHTHREQSRHYLPHRDRYRDRDRARHRGRDDRGRDYRDRSRDDRDYRNRDRVEGSAYQGKQMEPGESEKRPQNSVRYPSTTTTTSLDKNVSNEEISSSNTLEIDTQDVYLHSVIENNATHTTEYFLQLHRQERQLAKTRASPNETGWSPVDIRTSPEPAVTSSSNPGVSTGISQCTLSTSSSAVPRPSTSNSTHPDAPLQSAFERAASPGETGWSPAESEWSPVETEWSPVETRPSTNETAVTRPLNQGASNRVEKAATKPSNSGVLTRVSQRASSSSSSVAPRPSSSNTTHSNAPLQNAFEAAASPGETGWSPAESERSQVETRTSPNETAVTRPLNQGVSNRVEKAATKGPTKASNSRVLTRVSQRASCSFSSAAPRPSTSNSTHPDAPLQSAFEAAASPGETGWSPVESEWSPVETEWSPVDTRTSPNETAVTSPLNQVVFNRVEKAATKASNSGVLTRVSQCASSSFSSAAPRPSMSNTSHPNAAMYRTHGPAASSSSSSRPAASRISNSLEGNKPLDRRRTSSTLLGEIDPGAQKAADLVRQRYPPVQGPPIISATSDLDRWNPHGGSRKRKAHAVTTDVSSLRERANREGSSPPKRAAIDPTRRNNLKKMQEGYRGRKNWK